MKKIAFILILFLAFSGQIDGQKKKVKITNIEMDVVDNKVLIDYDILNSNPKNTHQVDLKFISQDFNFVIPSTLSGDFGKDVSPGRRKMIEWDITSNMNTSTGLSLAELLPLHVRISITGSRIKHFHSFIF